MNLSAHRTLAGIRVQRGNAIALFTGVMYMRHSKSRLIGVALGDIQVCGGNGSIFHLVQPTELMRQRAYGC